MTFTPAEPLSQHAVESEIMRLSALAESVTHKLAVRAREAAEADSAYKAGHAKAFLLADGSVAVREAEAAVLCEELYRQKRATEALLLSATEAGRNTRAQLDALRSIAANLRALVAS